MLLRLPVCTFIRASSARANKTGYLGPTRLSTHISSCENRRSLNRWLSTRQRIIGTGQSTYHEISEASHTADGKSWRERRQVGTDRKEPEPQRINSRHRSSPDITYTSGDPCLRHFIQTCHDTNSRELEIIMGDVIFKKLCYLGKEKVPKRITAPYSPGVEGSLGVSSQRMVQRGWGRREGSRGKSTPPVDILRNVGMPGTSV